MARQRRVSARYVPATHVCPLASPRKRGRGEETAAPSPDASLNCRRLLPKREYPVFRSFAAQSRRAGTLDHPLLRVMTPFCVSGERRDNEPNTFAPEGASRCRTLTSGLKGRAAGRKEGLFEKWRDLQRYRGRSQEKLPVEERQIFPSHGKQSAFPVSGGTQKGGLAVRAAAAFPAALRSNRICGRAVGRKDLKVR
jgi:hypothetical protein